MINLPLNFQTLAKTESCNYAIIKHYSKPIYGVQFHPEVTHSQFGSEFLYNFATQVCNSKDNWTMANFIESAIQQIQTTVGDTDHVIGGVSGGIDSTVAAMLMQKAIGSRFHGVLIDNGLLRLDEAQDVSKCLTSLGINLKVVDASKIFLENLTGVTDPEEKRHIIGKTFIQEFEKECQDIPNVKYLLQGTLYTDVIESKGSIKTHHNTIVDSNVLTVIEPLRDLYKDQVRSIARILGVCDSIIERHPFPGPGISIRILGAVDQHQVSIVQQADHIFITELKKVGIYNRISQAYAALLPVKAVGIKGDKRTHEQVIVLRAVQTDDFMTAKWCRIPYELLDTISNKILNQVQGVNRCVYDISSKPPATIEWE